MIERRFGSTRRTANGGCLARAATKFPSVSFGPITARIADGVAAIPAADWDACAGPGNPFVGHAFLSISSNRAAWRGTGGSHCRS